MIASAVVIVITAIYFSPHFAETREVSQQDGFATLFMANATGEFSSRLTKELRSLPKEWQDDPSKVDKTFKDAQRGLIEYSLSKMHHLADDATLRRWGFRAWQQDVNGTPAVFVTFSSPSFSIHDRSFDPARR
jgi:hypothetical protein